VPAQRAAALRLLSRALKRIAAGVAAASASTTTPQRVSAPAPGVSWAALWVHGVKDAQLPLLLRTSLDDSAPAVAAAAAAAIAAMVAPTAEDAAWEAHVDALAEDGDAVPPAAPHWRPRASAGWEAVAPPDGHNEDDDEGAMTSGMANAGEGDADADAVDPLAALLRMGFTARARFLLEAARNGGAAAPLLRALLAAARHSAAAAEGVAATPRLLRTLREAFIEAPAPAPCGSTPGVASGGAAAALAAPGVAGADAAAEAEYWAARPLALRVLRALARASPAAAAAIAHDGVVAAAAARFAPLPSAQPEVRACARVCMLCAGSVLCVRYAVRGASRALHHPSCAARCVPSVCAFIRCSARHACATRRRRCTRRRASPRRAVWDRAAAAARAARPHQPRQRHSVFFSQRRRVHAGRRCGHRPRGANPRR
jgi:hypothetical protein